MATVIEKKKTNVKFNVVKINKSFFAKTSIIESTKIKIH